MSQPHLSVWENAARSELMEKLFFLDGRDKKTHPKHGTFIGLWEELEIRKKWNLLLGNR
jgi:hypothetical protein